MSFDATFNLESLLSHFHAIAMCYQSAFIDKKKLVMLLTLTSDASSIKLALKTKMTYFAELDAYSSFMSVEPFFPHKIPNALYPVRKIRDKMHEACTITWGYDLAAH